MRSEYIRKGALFNEFGPPIIEILKDILDPASKVLLSQDEVKGCFDDSIRCCCAGSI